MLSILIIIILLFGLSVLFPKNNLLSYILVGFVIILYAYSQDDYDYYYYESFYESVLYSKRNYEVIFDWLMRLCATLGYDYISFRLIVGVISCLILFFAIKKLTPNVNLVWSLYIIYSALFNACLLRYSLTLGLVIYLIISLINSNYKLAYILCIICGFSHSSQWILLLFPVFWYVLNNFKNKGLIFIMLILIYLTLPIFGAYIFKIFSLFSLKQGVVEGYATGSYANLYGTLFNILKYGLIISPILYIKYFWKNEHSLILGTYPAIAKSIGKLRNNSIKTIFKDKILIINLLFAIILIPQYFAINYDRLFRVLIIINYIYISIIAYENYKLNLSIIIIAFIYAISFNLLIFLYSSPELLDRILFMHFDTNSYLLNINEFIEKIF